MFEVTGESVLVLYGSHVTGTPASTLMVLSATTLSAAAQGALEKSATSLEFGSVPLALVVAEADEGKLGAEDVRTIVEGLDPVALVAADALSAELLSAAYRMPVALDASNRLLGRTAVIFEDFEGMMDTPEGKQRAWALLKKLRWGQPLRGLHPTSAAAGRRPIACRTKQGGA